MLQQNAVAPATLELLKEICAISELESFGLDGGTSNLKSLLKKLLCLHSQTFRICQAYSRNKNIK